MKAPERHPLQSSGLSTPDPQGSEAPSRQEPVRSISKPSGWPRYLTLLAALVVAGVFGVSTVLRDHGLQSAAQGAEVPASVAPPTNNVPMTDSSATSDAAATPPIALPQKPAGQAANPRVPEQAGSDQTASDAAPLPEPDEPTVPPAAVVATTPEAPEAVVTAPRPPSTRFVSGDVATLFESSWADDPTGTALEILRRSGPLAAQLSQEPLVAERLETALSGTAPFGTRDYADRIVLAMNSALDALAGDLADAGTGLCLIVGPGTTDQTYSCVQVADLNHTFSALPHRSRVDAMIADFGAGPSAVQMTRLADLHFTGNAWSLLREAHSMALAAELRNAWINAGVALEPATSELAASLVFLNAYLGAAQQERPDTWAQLEADEFGTAVATTWNQIVAAWVTTDAGYWNIAFLPDATPVTSITQGRAGSNRPPA